TSPASSDMPGGANSGPDDKKPASDQPGGLFVANVRSGSERHQRVRRCRLDRLGDDAPDLIRQPLQGLALLLDALVLIVMLAGDRGDVAVLVGLDGVVEAERDDQRGNIGVP